MNHRLVLGAFALSAPGLCFGCVRDWDSSAMTDSGGQPGVAGVGIDC